jgi:7-cyano-7-deazaguanine synthase in queuosine biosynthesis
MKKILLYSGGLDSYLIKELWKPDLLLYIDVNSKYSLGERVHFTCQSSTYDNLVIDELDLGKWEREDLIIPLRNMYLIMWATNYADEEGAEICIGATAGDRVYDKSESFVSMFEPVLNYLYQPQHWTNGKTFRINIDYKSKTKHQILKEYLDQGGTLEDAFNNSLSCYNPTWTDGKVAPCWKCKPCFRKFVAFALMGMKFDDLLLDTVIPYINENILPLIKAGTYGRGEEEHDVLKVLELNRQRLLNKN